MRFKILIIVLFLISLNNGYCEEEILYKGSMPRYQAIQREGYIFQRVTFAEGKATKWKIKISYGDKVLEQEIVKNKPNIYDFGKDMIEVRNEGVVGLEEEKWWMMAEGTGLFTIIRRVKSINWGMAPLIREGTFGDLRSIILENSVLKVELLPDKKGAIVHLINKVNGRDYIYSPSGEGVGGIQSSQGLGFVELMGGLDNVIEDKISLSHSKDKEKIELKLVGRYRDTATVYRTMTLRKDSSAIDIESIIEVKKSIAPERHVGNLRHRVEMSSGIDVFYYQGTDDQIKTLEYKSTDFRFKGSKWLAGIDRDTKEGLVSVYEPHKFGVIYVWLGGSYFSWEAWTEKIALSKGDKLRLKGRYYFMNGVDEVSSVNEEGICFIATDKEVYTKGESVTIKINVGLCDRKSGISLLEIKDEEGKKVYSDKTTVREIGAGVAEEIAYSWEAEVEDGKYECKVELYDKEGREIIGAKKLITVSSKIVNELNRLESEVMKAVKELEKDYLSTKSSKGKAVLRNKLFECQRIKLSAEQLKKAGRLQEAMEEYKKISKVKKGGEK